MHDENEDAKLTAADGVFLLPEHAEAILSQLEYDNVTGTIRPDLDDAALTDAFHALGAGLRTHRAF